MHATCLQTYDPRKREDYRVRNFQTGVEFSSFDSGFFVMEFVGDVDWLRHAETLKQCIQDTSNSGFVTCAPWVPEVVNIRSRLEAECSLLLEFGHTFCGYFPVRVDSIRRLLELRTEAGDWKSGEWCIGGCISELALPQRHSITSTALWDFAHVLDQSERVGCVLSLGEMLQTTLLIRRRKGVRESAGQSRGRVADESSARTKD